MGVLVPVASSFGPPVKIIEFRHGNAHTIMLQDAEIYVSAYHPPGSLACGRL
jgi:hypothetical protein